MAQDRDQPDLAQLRSEIRRLRDHLNDERRAREHLEAKFAEMDDAINYLRGMIKEVIRGQGRTRSAVA
jgi:hypothetical protein